jgi:hypothetical protein
MTIATLLATALVFRYFVIGDVAALSADDLTMMKVGCLSAGAIVCIAIAVAGDCSQDLKTGYLLQATPYKQQMGEMIGVLTSVFAISGVLLLLNSTFGFGDATPEHPFPLLAPQANIMKILVDGVLGGSVPWTLIMIGGAGAVIVEMLGLPALPFAVGLYLPLGLTTPIMVGGIVRWVVDRRKREKREHDPGVLSASGLVAGYGLTGVALAGVLALIVWRWNDPHWLNPVSGVEEAVSYGHLVPWLWVSIGALPMRWGLSEAWWDALPFFPFLLVVVWLWWCARKRPAITLLPGEVVAPGPPEPVTSSASPSEEIQPTAGPEIPEASEVSEDAPVLPEDGEGVEEPEQSDDYEASVSAAASRALRPLPPIPGLPASLRSQEDEDSQPAQNDMREEPTGSDSEPTEGVERFEPPAPKPEDQL